MADKPVKIELNCTTGEETIIPLTDAEIEQDRIAQAESDARKATEQAEAQAKAEAKASALAKLAELGLTEDEAKAIAG
jgi:hypothetical protein